MDLENLSTKDTEAQEFIQRVQEVWNATWKDAYSWGPRWSNFQDLSTAVDTGGKDGGKEGGLKRSRGQAQAAQAAQVHLVLKDRLHSCRACRISRDPVTLGKN